MIDRSMSVKDQYMLKHGKLITSIGVPVDADLKARIKRVKDRQDFNAWVRDLISSHLPELEAAEASASEQQSA